MQQEAAEPTSQTIIFARHIVGMAILALASPLIYYSSEPVAYWLASWLAPVVISAVVFGLYALFFTQHAKRSWPRSFFTLAWILVALCAAGPWISTLRERQTASQSALSPPQESSSFEATAGQKTDQEMMIEEYTNLLASTRFELRSAGIILSGENDDQFDRAARSFAQEAVKRGLEDRVGDIAASRYALEKAKLRMLQKYGKSKSQPTSKQSAAKPLSSFDDLDAAGIGRGYKPLTTAP
uniref:hypothetical protein n=1 Tax=Comamonas testosteroni TaxID=285 RepID=UPI0015F87682|nr:hypothetical protein [Comamonas testosteroni]